MHRYSIQLIVFAVIMVMTLGTVQNPFTVNYIETLKKDMNAGAEAVTKVRTDDLHAEIKRKAPDFMEEPQDAQIHKVWKAIPGLNGITVDVDTSFEKMKENGQFDEKKLVFKEKEPKVTLKDLPPAPLYKGHPDKKMVGFAVNVAWGEEYIPDMLKIMKDNGVKATFFLEGKWTKNNPELAKMIVDAGHEIGNHSYSHADFNRISKEVMKKELEQTNQVIDAVTGKKPVWFGPPSGSFNDQAVKTASELGMRTVLWTVDTIDWKHPPPEKIVSKITEAIHPGAIVLMHPTSSTVNALEPMIKNIKNKDLQLGNFSTMLSEKRVK